MASYSTSIQKDKDKPDSRILTERSAAIAKDKSSGAGVVEPTTTPISYPLSQQEPVSRTCRICFDTAFPETDLKTGQTTYGYDLQDGKMIRPCKCNGSQRYVHEHCLTLYRQNNALRGPYLRCPTCKFDYRFNSSTYEDLLAHRLAHAFASGIVTCAAIFIAGYVAIPLLSITIFYRQTLEYGFRIIPWYTFNRGWLDHFAQGTCLVGVLGFCMSLYDVFHMLLTQVWDSQLYFFGIMAAGKEFDFWAMNAAGVARFMFWLWCKIGAWSRCRLESGGSRVMDLDGDETL